MASKQDEEGLIWRTASASNGTACVEIAMKANGGVKVRDSKDPDKQALDFTPGEWKAFVQGVKHGEFDIN